MKNKEDKYNNLRTRTKRNYQEKDNYGGKKFFVVPEGTNFFELKKGVNKFDIIPYIVGTDKHPDLEKGEADYLLPIWVHRSIGPGKGDYVCPAKNYSKPCPICEEYDILLKEGETEEDDLNSLKAKQRVLYNVMGEDGELYLFHQSYFLFEKELLSEAMDDEEGELLLFSSPDNGYTIQFRDTQTKGLERFKKFRLIERKSPIPEQILEEAHSLDSLLIISSYDELKEALFGSGSLKKVEEEIEEETEEETEEEIGEETEKKPLRKKKGKKTNKKVCPEGFKFGDDHDEYDNCDKCESEIWTACEAASD